MPIKSASDDDDPTDARRAFLTAMQTLVRLPLLQAERDRRLGLRTAGFISGYRGSPLGGYDQELVRAGELLARHDVRFHPAINEDLAATACWGTQQVGLFPDPKYEGVFSVWYGKGPGLDRSMDAIKHANHAGTAPLGGVLALVGDDHLGKSSAFGHQSEFAFVDAMIPVIAPADLDEVLEFGLFGFALSRFCGSWVGMKLAGSLCESSATVRLPDAGRGWPAPQNYTPPPGGLHLRWPDDPLAMEDRTRRHRREAALAFIRAAGLDRIEGAAGPARLGIVASGRTYGVLREALRELGLDGDALDREGVRIFKPALAWPLEPTRALEFLRGLEQVLVVEDKRPLLEDQLKVFAHDRGLARPRIVGKRDEAGRTLLPESGEVEALPLAVLIGERIGWSAERLAALPARPAAPVDAPLSVRTPYFCSGCPHNTSTRVPAQAIAIGGIGCHTLAMFMDRGMRTFSHMGGEGGTWIGIAPFCGADHVFQNMGDGTFQHSGSMGIRAALAANANITFKILYNDAVAMTGGQPVEGRLTASRVTRVLAAEGVQTIAVVSDQPGQYESEGGLAARVTVHDRDELDAVQRRLASIPGVTALVYDQTCAAEKRRRRKAGTLSTPQRRVVINELVCEGCGDCGVQSNCLSIVPSETEFGTKRAIDQSSCNLDYSCLKGFCPSFVTVEGATLRRSSPRDLEAMPPPVVSAATSETCRILLAGVGGTGIVTVGAILGVAARLEGRAVRVNDVTGMAQKGGPVFGHVQISCASDALTTDTIPPGALDVLIAMDVVVADMPEAASRVGPATRVVANTDVVETGRFVQDREARVDLAALLGRLRSRCGPVDAIPAVRAATAAVGEPLAAGLLVIGYACQRGMVPLAPGSVVEAIGVHGGEVERNTAAFEWGRRIAADDAALAALGIPAAEELDFDARLARRVDFLTAYQDASWARRYRELVERVRAIENERVPGGGALANAVLVSAFKLMSYKDEYEVARLHLDPVFQTRIRQSFDGRLRLRYHLAPPNPFRPNRVPTRRTKTEFGSWVRLAFRLLVPFRRFRGSPLDPFGRSVERRMERKLIDDYFDLVDQLLGSLRSENHSLAVEIAALPETIRGFGHVKFDAMRQAQHRHQVLMERWQALG